MQADGLWLVGIGAFLLACVGLATAPLRLHLQFGGMGDTRRDRVAFACTGVGLIATAAGSLMVAIGSSPTVQFATLSVLAIVASCWLLLAWRVHALWVARHATAALELKVNQDLAREGWRFEAAGLLARWRWALLHPFDASDADSWPYAYLVKRIGEEPEGVSPEWYDNDGATLRANRPSLVTARTDELPDWLHDIAAVAADDGWVVLRRGQFVAFYTRTGRDFVTTELRAHPVVQGLVREQFIRRLQAHGLPTHRGARGQLSPGRGHDHQASATPGQSMGVSQSDD